MLTDCRVSADSQVWKHKHRFENDSIDVKGHTVFLFHTVYKLFTAGLCYCFYHSVTGQPTKAKGTGLCWAEEEESLQQDFKKQPYGKIVNTAKTILIST